MSAIAISLSRRRPSAALRAAGREQALLAGGQLFAGAGNLAFALVCAHVLAPREYSRLAAFLAAYLLLYMPFSALSAGGALAPAAVARRRARALAVGGAVAVPLVSAAVAGLAPSLGLGASLLLTLAFAAPVAGLLALERGRALGDGRHPEAIASLIAEPVIRLGLGIPAAVALGAPGAAAAVVLGGYAALLAASRRTRPVSEPGFRRRASARPRPAALGGVGITAAFVLLAVLQNQDVLWANAQLGGAEAARFAVLSTLGGMAAFASTTVPLVLLPRAQRRERGALAAAVGAAAVLGAVAVLPALVDGPALVSAIFGSRYGAVAPLIVPYLTAMALLGMSRVLVAHRCAVASARPILVLLGACALGQALLIALLGHDAAAVAHVTLAASVALALGLVVLATVSSRESARRRRTAGEGPVDAPTEGLAAAADPAATSLPAPYVGAVEAPPAPAAPTRPAAAPAPRRDHGDYGEVRVFRSRKLWLPSAVWWALPALTVAGLFLRAGAGRSLWLDEATSISQARMSFSGMLTSLRTTDVQPPLHDVVLWIINRIFGDSEFAMRSPSLIAGTLLIPLLYVIGRDLWDRRTGLLAAALVTAAPFVVWYSQEARMYGLFMLFASLALWSQVRILRDGGDGGDGSRRWGWWLLYSLSTAAMAWTQYFGLLFALVQQAAFVIAIVLRREERRSLVLPWLASLLVMAICVAPLLPFVYHQYQINQASGRGFGVTPSQNGTDLEAGHTKPTVYAVLTNVVWGVWGYHSTPTMSALTALWPAGILLALGSLGRGRSWRVALLVALAGVPVAILFMVGQLKPFLFEIRYFCAGVPVALLLLARMCSSWPGRRAVAAAAVTAITAASFLFAFDDQQFSQTNPRLYDFQGALQRIQHQMQPGDELLYAPQYLNDLVGYYQPHMQSAPLTANPAGAAPHGRVFIMASFQEQPQNARFVRGAIDQLLRAHRAEIETFKRPQVQVWVFQ